MDHRSDPGVLQVLAEPIAVAACFQNVFVEDVSCVWDFERWSCGWKFVENRGVSARYPLPFLGPFVEMVEFESNDRRLN